jgi:hypothetical protein
MVALSTPATGVLAIALIPAASGFGPTPLDVTPLDLAVSVVGPGVQQRAAQVIVLVRWHMP